MENAMSLKNAAQYLTYMRSRITSNSDPINWNLSKALEEICRELEKLSSIKNDLEVVQRDVQAIKSRAS